MKTARLRLLCAAMASAFGLATGAAAPAAAAAGASFRASDPALVQVFDAAKAFDNLPNATLPMRRASNRLNGSSVPNWALGFALEVEDLCGRTGDRATAERLKPVFEALVKYLRTFRGDDGLLENLPSWTFVAPGLADESGPGASGPANMAWADALDALARLYGRSDLAAEAARVRESVRRLSLTGYSLYLADCTGTLWANDPTWASRVRDAAPHAADLFVQGVLGIEVDHVAKTVALTQTDIDLDFCGVTLPVADGELIYDWRRVGDRNTDMFRAPDGWRLVRRPARPCRASR